MIRIITDSSTFYNVDEGKENGVEVVLLSVSINDITYREYQDINAEEFVSIINEGYNPTSSQPPIGEFLEVIESFADDEIIVISMADGLSGTYHSWLGAKEISEHKNIEIINSKTLAYPHRYIVDEAVKLRDEGKSMNEIVTEVEALADSCISFLLPTDFGFLRRGGRLTPIAATMSGLLRIQPVVTQTEDGTRLEKFTVGRNFNIAVKKILENLVSLGITKDTYNFGISHSLLPDRAAQVEEKIKEVFGDATVVINELSCAFITQGGPSCLAIQVVQK